MTYYLTQIRIANSRWNVFHLRVVKIITALVTSPITVKTCLQLLSHALALSCCC